MLKILLKLQNNVPKSKSPTMTQIKKLALRYYSTSRQHSKNMFTIFLRLFHLNKKNHTKNSKMLNIIKCNCYDIFSLFNNIVIYFQLITFSFNQSYILNLQVGESNLFTSSGKSVFN